MTNKELELWQGEFGDEYRERNKITLEDMQARVKMWAGILNSNCGLSADYTYPSSILEVGCGQGINLLAINQIYSIMEKNVLLFALEPNKETLKVANENFRDIGRTFIPVEGNILDIELPTHSVELVFTSGVLIHVRPDNLIKACSELYRVSKKYIIIAEYFSPELCEVIYHDKKALWTCDFGKLFLDNFPIKFIGCLFLWKPICKVDNLTVWIFEKVN